MDEDDPQRMTFPEFLRRVHKDDVTTGKAVMHKVGVCDICDAAREERAS